MKLIPIDDDLYHTLCGYLDRVMIAGSESATHHKVLVAVRGAKSINASISPQPRVDAPKKLEEGKTSPAESPATDKKEGKK